MQWQAKQPDRQRRMPMEHAQAFAGAHPDNERMKEVQRNA